MVSSPGYPQSNYNDSFGYAYVSLGNFLVIVEKSSYFLNSIIYRIRIVAACQMFLQNFPMDVQECEMKIESCEYFPLRIIRKIPCRTTRSAMLVIVVKSLRCSTIAECLCIDG